MNLLPHRLQLTRDVFSLIDQFLYMKEKKAFLQAWLTLKNYSLPQNVNSYPSIFLNLAEKPDNEKTMSVQGSSVESSMIDRSLPLQQGQRLLIVNRQSPQFDNSRNDTDFEDKIIQKILFLEEIVNEMRANLQLKQLEQQQSINNLGRLPLPQKMNLNLNSRYRHSAYEKLNTPMRGLSDRQSDRMSLISSQCNKTEILGQMFDDQTESVRNMIQAVRSRDPNHLPRTRKRFITNNNSPRESQVSTFTQSAYGTKVTSKFRPSKQKDDTMSAPGMIDEIASLNDISIISSYVNPIYQAIQSLASEDQFKRHSVSYKKNRILSQDNEKQFSFDGSESGYGSSRQSPMPNFVRKQKCGIFEAGKSPEIVPKKNESRTQRTQRSLGPRFKRSSK